MIPKRVTILSRPPHGTDHREAAYRARGVHRIDRLHRLDTMFNELVDGLYLEYGSNPGNRRPFPGLLKNPRFCGSVFRYPLAREGNIRDVGTQEPRPDGIVRHRFARTLDSRRSHIGPREPGTGPELPARGGIGLLLRGQRPSGDRPGSGGSLDVGGSSAGVRARPSVDARGAGEPRDPVVHRLRAGG